MSFELPVSKQVKAPRKKQAPRSVLTRAENLNDELLEEYEALYEDEISQRGLRKQARRRRDADYDFY